MQYAAPYVFWDTTVCFIVAFNKELFACIPKMFLGKQELSGT